MQYEFPDIWIKATKEKYYPKFRVCWRNMLSRCYDSKTNGFQRYGGRGIRVCKRWHCFGDFYNDMYSSFCEHWRFHDGNTQLDRINNDEHYFPENCQWLTRQKNTAKANHHHSGRRGWDVWCDLCSSPMIAESAKEHSCKKSRANCTIATFHARDDRLERARSLLGDRVTSLDEFYADVRT